MKTKYNIGIDIGSTTLKIVVLDRFGEVKHKVYRRHKADFNQVLLQELQQVRSLFQKEGSTEFTIEVTGSAGMGVSERTGISFVQEVVSSIRVVQERYSNARTLIDLGGEDAKIVFFDEGKQPDIRMNGSCAGGTGSFIDQMADLMNIPVEQLADEALEHKKVFRLLPVSGCLARTIWRIFSPGNFLPRASRCWYFKPLHFRATPRSHAAATSHP